MAQAAQQQKPDKKAAGRNASAVEAATAFVADFGASVPPPKPSKPSLAALAQVPSHLHL